MNDDSKIIKIGDKFGYWTVLELNSSKTTHRYKYHLCECECGNKKEVYKDNLINKQSTKCRKCATELTFTKNNPNITRTNKIIKSVKSIIGKKFKNFTVLKVVKSTLFSGMAFDYLCLCDCGEKSLKNEMQLKSRNRGPFCDHCKPIKKVK